MKITEEEKQAIMDSCTDDSVKIIRYLEESQKHQQRYNALVLVVTIFGAIGSVVAAVTGIILLFQ